MSVSKSVSNPKKYRSVSLCVALDRQKLTRTSQPKQSLFQKLIILTALTEATACNQSTVVRIELFELN